MMSWHRLKWLNRSGLAAMKRRDSKDLGNPAGMSAQIVGLNMEAAGSETTGKETRHHPVHDGRMQNRNITPGNTGTTDVGPDGKTGEDIT
jgi:hypothetical protein